MKLWKSPILYVGVLLILAVGAALAAPYVVDWSRYRPSIENFGSQLVGRKLTVAGPISVRLFPWPKLSLQDVKMASLPGSASPDFLTVERVDIKMALAGLLNGTIFVEAVDLTRPNIVFERLASGQGNWRIETSPKIAAGGLLDRVKLDQITVSDGSINLVDARRGGRAHIDSVDLAFSAPAFAGPWRIRGSGKYKDRPIELGIDTGAYKVGQPLKFGFRIAPADGSGLAFSFDGQNEGPRVSGQLKIEPAPSVAGKGDAEGGLRPLVFKSQVASDFDNIDFKNIEISPRDGEPGANIVSGQAHVKLGEVIDLDAQLSASRFDLDTIAGAKARTLLREGQGIAILKAVVDAMPDNLEARTQLGLRSLVAGGETLDNVKLDVEIADGALRIHELSAGMPGQSEGLFDGIFLVTDDGPQLAGDLALESQNLREFVRWALPEGRDWIAANWTGSRGRLKLQTRLDLLPDKYRASEANFEIDGSRYSGSLAITAGREPRTDISLKSELIDLDSFVPGGLVAHTGLAALAKLAAPGATNSADMAWPRFALSLAADRLVLNGKEAHDTVVDIASTGTDLDIRKVEIGRVGDAKLEFSGLVSQGEAGAAGRVSTRIVASDPRGMVHLLGLVEPQSDPAWLAALGETDMGIVAELKPDPAGSRLVVDAQGKAGAYAIKGSAAMAVGAAQLQQVSGSLDITTPTSSALAALVGFEPVVAVESPGHLVITADGALDKGLVADIQAELFGAKFDYRGTLRRSGTSYASEGRGGFHTDRPQSLLQAIGLAWPVSGIFSLEGDVSSENDTVKFTGLQGVAGTESFSGNLTLKAREVTGEIAGGSFAIPDLLAATLLAWTGGQPDPEGPFATGLPFGLTGEVWFKPRQLAIAGGSEVKESQIGLIAAPGSVQFALFGKADDGQKVSFDLTSKVDGDGRSIEGKISMPGDLAALLRTLDGNSVASGTVTIDASFRGRGRSLASALADLEGGGTYSLKGAAVSRIDLAGFTQAAKAAKSAVDVRDALSVLATGQSLVLPDAAGTITAIGGRVAMLPIGLRNADADILIKPTADLAAGSMDVDIGIQLKAIPDLPGMRFVYAGGPLALARAVDTTELESYLGLKVLREGMSELERLQQEQVRVLQEEEKYHQEDEARYQAYLEQRRELQTRQRELLVQRKMRAEDEKRAKEEARKARDEARKAKKKKPAEATTDSSDSSPIDITPGVPVPVILVPPEPAPAIEPDSTIWPFGGLAPTDSEQMRRLRGRQR